ncbi:hypothetical protein ACFL2X_07205 [Candidatus Latescibacterota bacterium]
MKKSAINIMACLLMLLMAGTAFADKTISQNNAKSIGMGGTKVAGGFNYNGFIDNPALLSRVKGIRFSIARIPVAINKDLLDLGNFINDNTENFERFGNESLLEDANGDPLPGQDEETGMTETQKSDFLYDLEEFDGQWSRVEVSPMVDIALNIKGFGIGLAAYNQTEVNIKADKGIYDPRVWGEGTSSTVFALGMSRPLSILTPGLIVGANIKYVERSRASLFTISASDLGNAEETLIPVQDELKEDAQKSIMVDIGAVYSIPAIDAEVAGVFKSLGDGRGSSIDIGIAKQMYKNRLTLLADYIDFSDNNKENIFRKVSVGAQYKLALISLRTGINAGYPSFGLGLDLGIVDIDAAYYTKELTKGPGGSGENRYIAQFQIGW